MTAFSTLLEKLSAASTPADYLATQSECLAIAKEEEVFELSRATASNSLSRLDALQLLFWLTAPSERVARFQRLFEEAVEEDREVLKALLFRAITEHAVRTSNPERVGLYLESVREEFAKSLFVA